MNYSNRMIDFVKFVGIFFLLVLLISILYYAFTVIPPVRTIGNDTPQQQMIEYVYTNQFAPLLGYRIKPTDFSTPEKKIYDMSGNLI